MLKIAVCDDDEKICNLLENYINDSCRILHIEAETESFISGKSVETETSGKGKLSDLFSGY